MDNQLKATAHRNWGPGEKPSWVVSQRVALAGVFISFCVGILVLPLNASGQAEVQTLGGGRTSPTGADAGFADGNTLQSSQFNYPAGVAVDASGAIYVADRNNGALRKLDREANRATTMLRNLLQPVALAMGTNRELFILTQGDGAIRRMDRFGNVEVLRARMNSPTAVAQGPDGMLYITETAGTVVRVDLEFQVREVLRTGLNRPQGIAYLNSGLLAVSDTGNHRILFLDPANGLTAAQVGLGVAGYRDGSLAHAMFNEPHQLATAPSGSLLVADRLNHRLRLVNADGTVTTVYGKSPADWEGPECATCTPIILPGWLDGPSDIAEGRELVGVGVTALGVVYTTETFYHLIREVTGVGGIGSTPGGGSTNLTVLPPVITPDSGYYPLGQPITVFNPNTNAFFSSAIYYTLDGSDPTTNSLRVALQDNVGTIRWRNPTRDLRALRLVAYVGARASEITGGVAPKQNEIGITRDVAAGVGSTVVLPVSVQLRDSDQLKSLQFRVEITAETASVPTIPESFRPLPVSTNDFVPVVTSSEPGDPARFTAASYAFGRTRGYAITFIGTNANLSIKNFGVTAMLAVPIPAEARVGDRYVVEVLQPSGTSDGLEANLPLRAMPPRFIVAERVGYLVGDSSPASWYNADLPGLGFGDEILNNSDVNNVFAASLGDRVPYRFTDLFDAMDAYPEDTVGVAGGDGLIRFLDWQVVLRRSLGLEPALWRRTWIGNGSRSATRETDGAATTFSARSVSGARGDVWIRQALVVVQDVGSVQPGVDVEVPVEISVAAGARLAGLAFRCAVVGLAGAPAIGQPLQFVPGAGVSPPIQVSGPGGAVLCGWPIVPSAAFQPALEGVQRLGTVRVRIPANALSGQAYSLALLNADGAPGFQTQYDLETRSGMISIGTAARVERLVSDDWRQHFFPGNSQGAAPGADPDGDTVPNWAEYAAGTDPTRAESRLHFTVEPVRNTPSSGWTLRWLSAPGKRYAIQSASELPNGPWKTVADGLAGTGDYLEWVAPAGSGEFYRLELIAPPVRTPSY